MHRCSKFRRERKECDWCAIGPFRQREVENVYTCVDCGKERPSQFRKVIALEKEITTPRHGTAEVSVRDLARSVEAVCKTTQQLLAAPLMKRLGGVRIESALEQLATYAPMRLVYRRQNGSFRLHGVRVLDRAALSEVAHPGATNRRATALAGARRAVTGLTHPAAQSIRELLEEEDSVMFDARVVTALAGLAQLVESGDVIPLRAFSAKVLGSSKAFSPIRNHVERLVGPIEHLGIRDWGGLVLMGGAGMLSCAKGDLGIDPFRYIGCSSEDILCMQRLQVPKHGVLLVENLTPFHACIDQVSGDRSLLIVWSGGFPNRGVTHLIQAAASAKARIRVWCDLDLGGVRIARLVHRLTGGSAEPVLMEPDLVRTARLGCKLPQEQLRSIEHDLDSHPDDILSETLRALLERGEWFEQETLLSKIPELIRL